MKTTRREFMRNVGIALAAIAATRCVPLGPTCYAPPPPTARPGAGGAWDQLRDQWALLDWLAQEAQDLERGETTRDQLIADHRAALDDLIALGEIAPIVANDMQVAFESAATHVWRANAPITCYIAAPGPSYGFESSSDLAQQADALETMTAASGIDPATVEQVRAAIARDVAFLSLTTDEQQELIDAVVEAAGEGGPYPSLAELDLDVPPECVEAAQHLIELLLGQK